MLPALIALAAAFTPLRTDAATRTFGRRALLQTTAAAVCTAPLAALADGANSAATKEKARAIYGSRVYRLAGASTERILEEKNAITLFISGTYRVGINGNPGDKEKNKALTALEKKAVKAAEKGDQGAAQAAIKELIALAGIKGELDGESGNYNPKQRRNPGAPPTSEIVAQMGTQSYALYQPTKPGAAPPIK